MGLVLRMCVLCGEAENDALVSREIEAHHAGQTWRHLFDPRVTRDHDGRERVPQKPRPSRASTPAGQTGREAGAGMARAARAWREPGTSLARAWHERKWGARPGRDTR